MNDETTKYLIAQIKVAIEHENPEMVAAITRFCEVYTKGYWTNNLSKVGNEMDNDIGLVS